MGGLGVPNATRIHSKLFLVRARGFRDLSKLNIRYCNRSLGRELLTCHPSNSGRYRFGGCYLGS